MVISFVGSLYLCVDTYVYIAAFYSSHLVARLSARTQFSLRIQGFLADTVSILRTAKNQRYSREWLVSHITAYIHSVVRLPSSQKLQSTIACSRE